MSFDVFSENPPPRSRMVWATAIYVVTFLIFAVAAQLWPMPTDEASSKSPGFLIPLFISALVGSAVGIYWTWTFCVGETSNEALKSRLFFGITADLVLNYLATITPKTPDGTFLSGVLMGLGNFAVLWAAIGLGLWVARGLQKPNYLIMAAIVGAVTDIASVFGGPSKFVLSSPILFPYISFQWGQLGQGGVQPMIGAGDFIFLSLYFFGARKFNLNEKTTLWAMIVACTIGFLSVLILQRALPALPFFSAALLLVHGRELKRQFDEIKMAELASAVEPAQ